MTRERKNKKITTTVINTHLKTARQLNRKGLALLQKEQFERALEIFLEIETKFGTRKEVVLAEQVAIALLEISVIVGLLSEEDEAIGLCETVISRYEDNGDLVLQVQVAQAKLIQCSFLDNTDKSDEAIENCNWVIERYSESEHLELIECFVTALLTKANSLKIAGRLSMEQLEPLDALLDRFKIGQSSIIDNHICSAMYHKATLLGLVLDLETEAIYLYDILVQLFDTEKSPQNVHLNIIKSLVNKAALLTLIDRFEEASEVCDITLSRFEHYPEHYSKELLPAQQILDICDNEDPALSRIIGLSVRARACFSSGAAITGSRALEELLELLPKTSKVNRSLLDTLAYISYHSGSQKLLSLIEASPSLDMLQPMVNDIKTEIAKEKFLTVRP